jgi:hypothetical protein
VNKDNNKKLEKKDLYYGFSIIYLVSILVAVIVWKYSDSKILVDQISFASSIASIILAVVAMIYAFFQTKESSSQNVIVQETLHKISQRVDELMAIRGDISEFKSSQESMLSTLNSISISIDSISDEKDVPETVQRKLKNAQEQLDREINVLNSKIFANPNSLYRIKKLVQIDYKIGDQFSLIDLLSKIYLDVTKVELSVIRGIGTFLLQSGLVEKVDDGRRKFTFKRVQ